MLSWTGDINRFRTKKLYSNLYFEQNTLSYEENDICDKITQYSTQCFDKYPNRNLNTIQS